MSINNQALDEAIKSQVFQMKAVLGERSYEHFGISEELAYMYGHEAKEVCSVNMKVSDDQRKPVSNDGNMDADYWGWYDFERGDFTNVYPKLFLLDMCFAYGIKAAEGANQGKAYRLEIVT